VFLTEMQAALRNQTPQNLAGVSHRATVWLSLIWRCQESPHAKQARAGGPPPYNWKGEGGGPCISSFFE
jgi:hypothetical protein